MWLRAFILCDDVRFEVGGTMTLVGVFADQLIVPPGDGDLVIPRLAIYSVIAGLTGATELSWRQTLSEVGSPPGEPLVRGSEPHASDADEHRLVNIVSPLMLPGPGRYRLTLDFETRQERRSVHHHFIVERMPPPPG
jgi:hypothetical protein